jgi:hypothetical protein
MSDPYAMLDLSTTTQGVQMDEFYTNATQVAIWNEELQAEKLQQALLDAYDPYDDYDDQGNEDAGWEEGLFGWE